MHQILITTGTIDGGVHTVIAQFHTEAAALRAVQIVTAKDITAPRRTALYLGGDE